MTCYCTEGPDSMNSSDVCLQKVTQILYKAGHCPRKASAHVEQSFAAKCTVLMGNQLFDSS